MAERLLIYGGRDFRDEDEAFAFLDRLHSERPVALVIEGGARGGDAIGRAWAEARGIEVVTYFADLSGLGKLAPASVLTPQGHARPGRLAVLVEVF